MLIVDRILNLYPLFVGDEIGPQSIQTATLDFHYYNPKGRLIILANSAEINGNPIKENPENIENYRLVTIRYLQANCNKTWKNQRVYASTSNYIAYYKNSHKAFNIRRFLNNINIDRDTSDIIESS
ncbi:hypothetical protein WAI453_002626 [Rhynchosporium graminicola]